MTRSGHSLVELLVALGIGAMAIAAVYLARFGSATRISAGTADAIAMADVQTRLRQLVVEIQDATRIFYPLPGETQDGLGLTTSKSETVLFHVEPVSGESRSRLVRVNLTAVRKGAARGDATFLDHLHHARFEVAPAEPGKQASLVRIDLAVEIPGRTPETSVRVSYVSAAFPRNLERPIPDDVLLPGAPRVRNF